MWKWNMHWNKIWCMFDFVDNLGCFNSALVFINCFSLGLTAWHVQATDYIYSMKLRICSLMLVWEEYDSLVGQTTFHKSIYIYLHCIYCSEMQVKSPYRTNFHSHGSPISFYHYNKNILLKVLRVIEQRGHSKVVPICAWFKYAWQTMKWQFLPNNLISSSLAAVRLH